MLMKSLYLWAKWAILNLSARFRKEFCNSYYLQVHKASKHGIFDDPAASALMMMAAEREKAEREGQLMQASSNSPSPTSMAAGNSLRPVILTSEKERTKVMT